MLEETALHVFKKFEIEGSEEGSLDPGRPSTATGVGLQDENRVSLLEHFGRPR